MKRLSLLLFTLLFIPQQVKCEEGSFSLKPYGFARTDFYYNSRDCVAGVNDIFNLYPMDISLDAAGEDLNDYPSSGFFAFITRLGVDIAAPKVGNAVATAKIEIDFGGYGTENTILRIRHAYINLKWQGGSNLVLGQTWHPLFGEVFPTMTNVSTGAPFQPFSRTPQIKYSYRTASNVKFTAAALWQLQYKSSGYNSLGEIESSVSYQTHSCIPEFYAGVDYYRGGWLLGAGVNVLNISPRTQYTWGVDNDIYKVRELMTATSAELHLRYTGGGWNIAAKSIYASALDHTTMLGGYAVSAINTTTGEQEYTPLHNSTTWVNVIYGNKWQPSLFVGYTKNLGASRDIVGDIFGRGTDIDQLLGCNLGLTYRLAHFAVSLEYAMQGAWYGSNDSRGAVVDTHSVYNHRIASAVALFF